ncbi:unnamed protein product [Arabidopsis lyrata]|uniref:Uncharacterized protein n=2 Tax=Arabidopsis TaxID=3701 RepID=A0A8T2B8L9_ARASU|nr:hypothetical protein ISN45_Aa03g020170 [Arabidopsis thaliana x Arabidopsis arenosa]KAG7582463.1 hypothetical protein ISN44_As08g020590 [Arabidopsis suecica]CAH8260979.1 unnamed protein product [Arabidopsis lyrata]
METTRLEYQRRCVFVKEQKLELASVLARILRNGLSSSSYCCDHN